MIETAALTFCKTAPPSQQAAAPIEVWLELIVLPVMVSVPEPLLNTAPPPSTELVAPPAVTELPVRVLSVIVRSPPLE